MESIELLSAVERLKDEWSARALYLERLAGYYDDSHAQANKEHARIIRSCVGELYDVLNRYGSNNKSD